LSVGALKLGDALKLLHRCMEEGGSITWGHHFKKALEDEKATFPDAWQILRHGRITRLPNPISRPVNGSTGSKATAQMAYGWQ
jgi:hypothetical protein